MRMRKRNNLEPRMDRCRQLMAEEPEKLKGRWLHSFGEYNGLYLELGCGKGRFTVDTAASEPDRLLVALEKVRDVMVIAMERARDRELKNLRFIDGDAAGLAYYFEPGEAERIYINFCDPWPKSRDAKLRLTAPGFLRLYCDLLPLGGQIHFKTDNRPLFDWSVKQLEDEGWQLSEITNDLHANGEPGGAMTDYELRFMESGVRINRLVATRTEATKGTAAGIPPRLRNAGLTDAIGYRVDTVVIGGEEQG